MKAKITKLGELEISVESELEAYALGQWVDKNVHQCTGEIKKENISFDWRLPEDKITTTTYHK